ncbi:MAG: pilus assembly protein [Candidatus Magnetoglobus multicellularis str. Araruama]|uniref:Pilus assembly protein n=1 Tax=Candidatus Magnetoglobus multicellularis str. Araruama TaxID=890399 RepID=A0A1V1PDN1_9BACT|nr:MAG: pilus assembly protein [Candidatus Magnetoglobus multicellularis str. Araruama]
MKNLFAISMMCILLFISSSINAQEALPDESSSSSPQLPADKSGPDIESLYQQIQTLQEEVTRLKEEAEVRKSLEMTQEEKTEKEKEILSAAGRQYTLLRKGILSVEDNVKYSFSSTDVIAEWGMVEHQSNHTIENALSFEYALLDNLTVNLTLPLIYKNDKNSTTESLSVNDIGDVSLGGQWQPFKTGGDWPAPIFYGNIVLPSGRSPFKIVIDEDLSTGNGFYSVNAGMSVNKSLDPIVAFANVSLGYNHTVRKLNQRYSTLILTKLKPGNTMGISTGIGYAFSYQVSMFMSYQYSYQFKSTYYWKNNESTSSGSSVSSMLNMGTRWNLSPRRSLTTQLGIGLTNSSQDFVLSVRIPFEFEIFSNKKAI